MADCNLATFTSFLSINWGGVSMDGSVAIGWSGFDIYSVSTATWTGETSIMSRSGLVWNAAVDASDDIWWTELNFGSGLNELWRANLDGSSPTLIDSNVQASGHIAYDMVGDRFWYVQFSSGLWTMTKTGVENQRYSNTAFPSWFKPVIANDGAAWLVYNTPLMVRVNGATYAAQTLSSGFSTGQPFYPGCDDDAITKNAGVVTSYKAGITSSPAGCTLGATGGGWPIWNGDMTRVWYTFTTSGGYQVWSFECVFEEGHPPMRILTRDDDLTGIPSGGPRHLQEMTSWQRSMRIRQGTGYV